MWNLFKSKEEIKKEILEELQAKEDKMKKQEPWVDIRGIVEDPRHGIKVDLDWNDEFVEYLRNNGITGADDEIIVQKWITMLYKDLVNQNQEAQSQGINNNLV